MVSETVLEALESARSAAIDTNDGFFANGRGQRRSRELTRAIVLAVVRELPDEMSVAELRDELEIANNQRGL